MLCGGMAITRVVKLDGIFLDKVSYPAFFHMVNFTVIIIVFAFICCDVYFCCSLHH